MKLTLSNAAKKGNLDDVKYLVEQQGVKASAHNSAALWHAVNRGYLDIVKYLVQKGANIDFKDQESALEVAALSGHFDVVKFLVEDLKRTEDIDEALRAASVHEYTDIIAYLKSQ